MKRIFILFTIIALVFCFSGCSSISNRHEVYSIEARKICNFVKLYPDVDVGIGFRDDIFVDKTTGVLYIRLYDIDGFAPIYNADGSLKIWKGDIPE